jgi:hypothetical protein
MTYDAQSLTYLKECGFDHWDCLSKVLATLLAEPGYSDRPQFGSTIVTAGLEVLSSAVDLEFVAIL